MMAYGIVFVLGYLFGAVTSSELGKLYKFLCQLKHHQPQ